jgi:hypothetical protein
MIRVHDQFRLDLADGDVFFARTVYEPKGCAPRLEFPQWNRCMLPRWLNGAYKMHRFSRPDDGGSVDFTPAGGCRYIEWNLAEGEALCIDLAKLVGFSGTVRLRPEISLRLTAFAMNRLSYTIALGPGLVVMESTGIPEVFRSAGEARPFPPSRLIAWSADSSFGLHLASGRLSHYLSPTYLTALETRGVVLDADDPKSNSKGFLTKMIRRIYAPFG